jgi:TIR domain/Effector-associated domain 1
MAEALTEQQLRELAAVFLEPLPTRQLLAEAGLPSERQPSPQDRTSEEFWQEVNGLVRSGILPDGPRRILAAALRRYPANPVFRASGTAGNGDGESVHLVQNRVDQWSSTGIGQNDPTAVTVVALDAVGFSRHGTLVQLAWRQGIRDVVSAAVAAAGIPAAAFRPEDRGDGYLALVAGTVPKSRIVADFVRELTIALSDYNRTRNAKGRIRMRVSIHQGDVVIDQTGFAGDAAVVATRLIDSHPVRAALETASAADLALIVSEDIYRSSVAQRFRGLDPATFQQVEVRVAKFSGTAWLHVPPGNWDVRGSTAAVPPTTVPPIANGENWDFLVSYASKDEDWGEWIAWELEAQRHRVHLEAWESVPGAHDVQRLHESVARSTRTLVVLSKSYLRSEQVQAEWQAAWQTDPLGMRRTLIPIRVEECEPDGLLRGIRCIDLAGLPSNEARRKLIGEIQASLAGRRSRASQRPQYPLDRLR